jgi:hypothetical protein
MTKAPLNSPAGASAAAIEPTATPATDGSAQARMTSGITSPRAACARYERTVVGTMIASEVPMHNCMRTSSGTPRMENTSNSTGTMKAPPPMPKSPARIPVTIPAAMTLATSHSGGIRAVIANLRYACR